MAARKSRLIYDCLLVAVGGFFGTLTRAILVQATKDVTIHELALSPWVWAILFVNLFGAFALGIFNGIKNEGELVRTSLVVGTGFFGSLTTYSTFALDVVTYRDVATGFGWGCAIIMIGAFVAMLGLHIGHRIRHQGAAPCDGGVCQ